MIRILVTGGAGFIGSHIVDEYIRHGHHVAVIDNLTHGRRQQVHARAVFYKTDIRNAAAVQRIMRRERPQLINHHAALSTVVQSLRAPQATLATNVTGTAALLAVAASVGIQKFIFASTGGTIYGNATVIPTPETAPLQPISMYAASKQLGEALVQYYARTNHFQYVILRYGNVFGVRQDPRGEAGVIAIFSQLMANGRRVTIFGDGRKTRDYIYITDATQVNHLALRKGKNVILNVGLGRQVSDRDIYNLIHSHWPTALPPQFKPVRAGEVMYGAIRSTAAQNILGWKPRWSVAQGVTDYLAQMHYV